MQPLLSDLCSICHKTTPKYRCPACLTRTCSLECVQKHKSWGCSGKRDPTAYIKKQQLATPSGVDHDFNFIAGIERSRDRVEEQLQGRSIQDAQGRSVRLNQPSFRNRLQLARVIVEYAPLGMTRQKLNKTRLTQSKRINWTVEWLHDDNTSSIGSIFDDEEIRKAYLPLHLKRTGAPRKKRKRDDGPAIPGVLADVQDIQTPSHDDPASANEVEGSSTFKRYHEGATDKEPLTTQDGDDSQTGAATKSIATIDNHSQADTLMEEMPNKDDAVIKDESNSRSSAAEPNPSLDNLNLHFYLVRPRTSGPEKVLIPLSPTDTFLTCLQNQTVLEFPTIQVLASAPEALPSGFIIEDEYLAKYKKQAHEMENLIQEEGEIDADTDRKVDEQVESRAGDDADGGAMPNTTTLLATLKRDMQ